MGRLLVALLILASLGSSQSGSGTLTGTVNDATGAPVPAARIKIVNLATGVSVETLSNEEGLYRASSLVPAAYRLEVDLPGFDRLVRSGVTVEVGQTVSLDLTLAVGAQTETMTVNEAPPLTESQSSNIAQTVNRQMLAGLPLPNRAASSLA